MYCTNCGTEVRTSAKFCYNCGAPVGYSVVKENRESNTEESEWIINAKNRQRKSSRCYMEDDDDEYDEYDDDDYDEYDDDDYDEHDEHDKPWNRFRGLTTDEKIEVIQLEYVGDILLSVFDNVYTQFGEQVYVVGKSYISPQIENKLERLWADEEFELPLLAFNYRNEMLEGFVITNKRIIWKYSGMVKRFCYLNNIADIVLGRAVLARVMRLQTYTGEVLPEIYLTGIENIDYFVFLIKEFLEIINDESSAPENFGEYTKTEENPGSQEFSDWLDETDIVNACHMIKIDSIYVTVGNPTIEYLNKKSRQARMHFNIPDYERIYLIYDATVFSSCKTGFAICLSGIYFNAGLGTVGYIAWSDYANCIVEKSSTKGICIGPYSFMAGGSDARKILQILITLKGMA